ncbi:putative kynureninase [Kalaharituber pfeilii]|nr:putative kynureninase [Kalaharituber pfeilii]
MDLNDLQSVMHGSAIPTTPSQASTLHYAKHLDSIDPLSHLRPEFYIPPKLDICPTTVCTKPGEPCVYFCGNSLGLQPKRTKTLIDEELEIWAKQGVTGHFRHPKSRPWVAIEETVTTHLAGIVGALPSEVAAMGSLTANIHLLLAGFYKPTEERYKIIIESKAFPSDHYAIVSQLQWHGHTESSALICISPTSSSSTLTTEQILRTIDIHARDAALLFLPGVQYYTGQAFDIAKITRYAQSKGLIVGWDLAHAAGNIPLDLHDWGVDFAAWCSYKYLNSGPGGIAGIFVHSKHDPSDRHRLAGWWGHDKSSRFQMDTTFHPLLGAPGYQLSNPSVLDTIAHLGSLQLFTAATPTALFTKSRRLTSYLYHLLTTPLLWPSSSSPTTTLTPNTPFEIITPRDPQARGAQLSLRFSDPKTLGHVFETLEREGIVVDVRKPDVIRVSPVPMYNTFEECWRFVQVLREAVGPGKMGEEGGETQRACHVH